VTESWRYGGHLTQFTRIKNAATNSNQTNLCSEHNNKM